MDGIAVENEIDEGRQRPAREVVLLEVLEIAIALCAVTVVVIEADDIIGERRASGGTLTRRKRGRSAQHRLC